MHKNILSVIGITILFLGVTVAPLTQGINIEGSTYQNNDIDWWPQHQHDPQNKGYSNSIAPNTDNILWKFKACKSRAGLSPPVVVNDRVYIGGAGEDLRIIAGFFTDKDFGGKLYCIDAITGGLLWMIDYPLEGDLHNSILATPVVNDDRIFVCPSTMDNPFGEVHCYNAINGSMLWVINSIGGVLSAGPTVANGMLFVTVKISKEMYRVFCLNIRNGEILWYFSASKLWGCPAVVDDKVYISRRGAPDNDWNFLCLNASTGEKVWTWVNPLKHGTMCSPIVVDDKIYIGSEGYGKGYPNGTTKYFPGTISCIDAITGATIWQSDIRMDFRTDFAFFDDKIYAGAELFWGNQNDQMFYCVDASSGEVIWEKIFPNPPGFMNPPNPSSVIVADDKVFVGHPGRFKCTYYCFDALSGDEIWNHTVYGWLTLCSGPAIADGQLYFPYSYMGCRDGTLYCFSDIYSEAPDAPCISGPKIGNLDEEHEYTFVSNDPNGDDVYYYINWGDGKLEKWIGPYNSGEKVTVNHTWSDKGKYEIRARAKDSNGLRGAIGTFKVNMPLNTPYNRQSKEQSSTQGFQWFLERFSMLERLLNFLK